ncbi:hypothetical protein CPB83DRAFT_862708 [Crepidotus variabilis]|uniref:Uncharacterized protein n=1 Tax=Crepidotus variabilis TaxID=179855 RepID=A0A9P6E708_9AGAR|nr:hypothetical protein CPB83DRAFT_862708 [Crepidotus variabilis]
MWSPTGPQRYIGVTIFFTPDNPLLLPAPILLSFLVALSLSFHQAGLIYNLPCCPGMPRAWLQH